MNPPQQISEVDSADNMHSQAKKYTVDELVTKINEVFQHKEAEEHITKVLSWKFETHSNVLKLLCEMQHERIAAKFMDYFPSESNWDFFFDCVYEERQYFLKYALRYQYFDLNYLYEARVVQWIIEKIKNGNNIIFPLNLLLYTDFRKWEVS